jgi:hypothetical protein
LALCGDEFHFNRAIRETDPLPQFGNDGEILKRRGVAVAEPIF